MSDCNYVIYLGHVGRTVADARRARGWSQEDLVSRAGGSLSTLSRIERGSMGSHRPLVRICTALEISWPDVVARAARLASYEPSVARRWVTLTPEEPTVMIAGEAYSLRDRVLRYDRSDEPVAGGLWVELYPGTRVRVRTDDRVEIEVTL